MGIFDLFRKKSDRISSSKNEFVTHTKQYETAFLSGNPMDEDRFWHIIEIAKRDSEDLDDLVQNITKHIKNLPLEDVIGFNLQEEKLRFDSYTSEMWCAGYILNGGCSDDSFEYFRCWIIAQGRDLFYKAKENPDTLYELYDSEIEYYDFEDLMYVASEVFEERTGKDIIDFLDYEQFTFHEGNHPDFEFNWIEDDEESMRKICPRLMEVAWEN